MKTIFFCGWLKWVTSQKVTMINLSHITVSLTGMAYPPPKARNNAMIVKFVDKLSLLWDELLLCETVKHFLDLLSDILEILF
jgi:hypothetical protein